MLEGNDEIYEILNSTNLHVVTCISTMQSNVIEEYNRQIVRFSSKDVQLKIT